MTGKRKNIFIYIIMVCCAVALSGCSGGYKGKDIVDKAKQIHTALESAHIIVEDIRDEQERPPVQEIWYRFVGDVMQYMYVGRDADTGEEYYEFNNGTELDTWHTGDTAWTGVAKGSEGYYNYSRTKRHYFADGGQILDDHAAAVKESEVSDEAGGGHIVRLRYDDSALSAYPSMEGVTGMEQFYSLNNSDAPIGYMILNVSYTKDGVFYKYRIRRVGTDPDKPIERIEPPALTQGVSGEMTENAQ